MTTARPATSPRRSGLGLFVLASEWVAGFSLPRREIGAFAGPCCLAGYAVRRCAAFLVLLVLARLFAGHSAARVAALVEFAQSCVMALRYAAG